MVTHENKYNIRKRSVTVSMYVMNFILKTEMFILN